MYMRVGDAHIDGKIHGRSVRDVTRRFLESMFEAQSGRSHLGSASLEKGQKGRMWVELVAETTPT